MAAAAVAVVAAVAAVVTDAILVAVTGRPGLMTVLVPAVDVNPQVMRRHRRDKCYVFEALNLS